MMTGMGLVWLVRDGAERRQPWARTVSVDAYEQRRDTLTGAAEPSAAAPITPSESSERS